MDFASHAENGARVAVIILLQLGANDSKSSNWRADRFAQDYEALVETFERLPTHRRVYLAMPLATGVTLQRDQLPSDPRRKVPRIRELRQKRQLPQIDQNSPTSSHPEYFEDGVHPNDAGYRVVARKVFEAMSH